MKRMSRKAFMDIMDGKKVTLMTTCVVGKEMFYKAIKSLYDTEKYHKVTTMPIDKKYTGIFHKRSHGFYRVMVDGTKSYKYFQTGDYILSDGKLSFIISTPTMRVCVYRVEN